MAEPKLKARIQNKYKRLAEWSTIQEGFFIPLKGEVCYGVQDDLLYQKIGDGFTDFVHLPWLINQSDNEENDETSPSYIKNRLAYPEYTEIPEDEQILLNDRLIAGELLEGKPIAPIADLVAEAGESLGNLILQLFPDTKNIALCSSEEGGIYTSPSDILVNPFHKLFLDIENVGSFNLHDSHIHETTNLTFLDFPISCIGNTNWANLLLNILGETMDAPIEYFPIDTTLSDKFCIIRIGPQISNDDDIAMEMMFTIFDTDVYNYQTSQESDGSVIYYYPLSLRLEALGQMHTIDKKYLGDIQADQFSTDINSSSHIRNRYGERCSLSLNTNSTEEMYGHYSGSVKLSKFELFGIYNVSSETVYSSWTTGAEKMITTCEVHVGGSRYPNCHLYKTSMVLDTMDYHSGAIASTYFLGNPKYIGDYLSQLGAYLDPETVKSFSNNGFMDNGLPFFFEIDFDNEKPIKSGNLIHIDGYGKEQTVSISIYPETIPMEINPLPVMFQEGQVVLGIRDPGKNSILLNSSYEASGTNSLAMGDGTRATGYESFAGGQDSQAMGKCSVALGQNTIVSSKGSFGFGSTPLSTELSSSSFTISDNYNILTSTNCSKYKYIRISSNVGYSNWYKISSVYNENGKYRIYLSSSLNTMCPGYTSISTVHLAAPLEISGTNSSGFGTGVISGSNSFGVGNNNIISAQSSIALGNNNTVNGGTNIVLGNNNRTTNYYSFIIGENLVSQSKNQTVLGYYNSPTSDLLIIGNGTASAQSNAMTLSNKGDATFAGSVETTSVILTSPNGTKFEIAIDDNGNLISTKI